MNNKVDVDLGTVKRKPAVSSDVQSQFVINPKILRESSIFEPIVKNPFVSTLDLSVLDRVKIGFNAVFLLPIRVTLIIITLIIGSVVAFFITFGFNDKDLKERPFTGWRKKFRGLFRFLGRAIVFFCGFHKIKKIGKRATIEEASIFVAAPHTSYFDAFVFFILGLPGGVSRSENAKIPLIGYIIKAVQPILVTREDSKNKLFVIEEIKKRADPENKWPQLLIFPEGTTTNGSCLITFKPGAFIPARPVQPVIVEYKNRLNTTCWTWSGLSAMKVGLYTLCQFNNNLQVTYLPVYTPNEDEKNDPKLYALNVRKIIANHLKVLTTSHTYEDCRLMLKARELDLPFESGLIEFDKIKEKLNINYDNCQETLQKFTLHARKSDGKMSLKDFSEYLELPPSPAVVQVFNMYDRDKDGLIDFREFLIGLSLLSQPVNTEDTLRMAFNMFDKNGKGYITLADLQSILFSAFAMPPEKVEEMFKKIDTKNDGVISYDEMKEFAEKKPEYARIFLVYNEIKILRSNVEIERIASPKPKKIIDENHNITTDSRLSKTNLVKRPMSDKTKNQMIIVNSIDQNPTNEDQNKSDKSNLNANQLHNNNQQINIVNSKENLSIESKKDF